ncbi:MAG: 16S rRNA (cytidine(1402)-2'-O)-methyltransferase [Patescibacteria group bacterium]|jgi:16S rRNA (cytidine1402-2'-O)-methyltransferase
MLYIVGTPIGNLEDISFRAIRILTEADFVLCEDTRNTGVLLKHYNITTKKISYHQHSDNVKVDQIIKLLEEGKTLALVTDAGTPGISDPGGVLVAKVLEHFGEDMKIESVPGPSAVTAALSISGVPTDKFIFMGFPPHKKGRQTFIKRILESEYPVVVYESKHRITKFLEELKALKENTDFEDDEKTVKKKKSLESVVVARELSKMHETVYRGDINDIINKISATTDDQRGEFVVIIG